MMNISIFEIALLVIVATAILVPVWKICVKAGYPGALSLLMLVPVGNVGLLLYLAFSEWPVLKELRSLRQG